MTPEDAAMAQFIAPQWPAASTEPVLLLAAVFIAAIACAIHAAMTAPEGDNPEDEEWW